MSTELQTFVHSATGKDGFVVDYNTKQNWVVTTPQGKKIIFQKDTGMCKGMSFIDMREHHDTFVMVQTVQKTSKDSPRNR